MQNPTSIPELVQRERFIKRVLANGTVSFVSGKDGWACVPFRNNPAIEVVLFWSNAAEARRWADVVTSEPSIHEIALPALLIQVLPMLAERRCLIGPDWSTDPADPIIDAHELADRIWRERTELFFANARETNAVWVLESAAGPAFLPSQRQQGKEYLPVWASREDAAAHIAGSWAVKRPIAVSLSVFADRYLPYLDQRGWFAGPEPMPGAGTRELTASEFSLRAFPSQTLAMMRAV
jgi:Protein of unknown function (DUF2750)